MLSRGFASIRRVERNRSISVTAKVDTQKANSNEILAELERGYLPSLFGIVALAGVVVNDSLILVDYVNRQRRSGVPLRESILKAGSARFRPIFLTSVTTFAGLTPMLMETSMQAQSLIPMAVSLAFGVVFSSPVILILVPCAYMILEDLGRAVRWLLGRRRAPVRNLPPR